VAALFAACVLASVGAVPASATAVNLLKNPNFDHDTTSWTTSGNVTWNSVSDQTGKIGGSGSAQVVSSDTNAASVFQCVNLPLQWRSADIVFTYWALSFNDNAGSTANGNALALLEAYDSPNCAGAVPLGTTSYFLPYTAASWKAAGGEKLTLPIKAMSVRVSLMSLNTAPNNPTQVLFDSVFFGVNTNTGVCGQDPSLLCVDGERFQITAQFSQPCATGTSNGDGISDTANGGFLWCLDPGNPEVFVKVLNACTETTGNSYWVFLSGLTNFGVTVTVKDMHSGDTKTYTNPVGTNFQPIFDTAGLQVCP
jgi:hypothetical protein